MIDVSIIIVSYNTSEMTLACLSSIYEQTKTLNFEIIVVDNNSSDNSVTAISEHFPNVILIASKTNLGFARANNLAARRAIGKYLLLLNPDTVVLDRAIDKLFSFACNNPKNLIYGGRTLFADYSLNPTSCYRKFTIWSLICYSFGLTFLFKNTKFFNPDSYGNWQCDKIRQVDIITGCFLMINYFFWQSLDGFDKNFFMYGEEADLCIRALKIGASPIIFPGATIIHYDGASDKNSNLKTIRLLNAKVRLMCKHWTYSRSIVGYRILCCGVLIRQLGYFLKKILLKKQNDRINKWKCVWNDRDKWSLSLIIKEY